MTLADLGRAGAAAAVAIVLVLAVTFASSRVAGRHSVIDTAWGLLFAAAALAAFLATAGAGNPARRYLLLAMTVGWGLRLALHIGRRSRGRPEDPRYERLLARAPGSRDRYALRVVYLLQGVLALAVSAPVLVAMVTPGPVAGLAWAGIALWGVGLFFEAVGDAQLQRWRSDPVHRGGVIDVGLWRYTRHPNYFGDACVWWGIFLVAAERWPGVLTVLAPVLMTVLLTRGSGVRIMEQHMRERPGWDAYAARTPVFLPRPSRRPPRDDRA
ncbi:MAG: DUF1295 domain-containing protein [Jatrophihabitans sp.]|nr:MAG: DUF1295 domain-containing protein [Jatrophihabitans sp.]